jgi:phosphonate transport system permease protein
VTQFGDRRTFRVVAAVLILAAVVTAFVGAEFDVGLLLGAKARAGARGFLADAWPPRTDGEFLGLLAGRAVDTLATALLGTLAALVIGLPLGALASRNVVHGALFAAGESRPRPAAVALHAAARACCAVFRSVPEVIWALLFVKVVGLGALPAIAALGVAYGGLIGKVFAEQMEDVSPRPVAALEAVGAGRAAAFAWGVLPQALTPMSAYAMYRFECAVRASVLMGFVGAGGLGFELQVSYGDYLPRELATETAFLLVIVLAIEWTSDRVRRWIA